MERLAERQNRAMGKGLRLVTVTVPSGVRVVYGAYSGRHADMIVRLARAFLDPRRIEVRPVHLT